MTADRRPDLEQFYRQVLHVEIAVGLTYARLAMNAYVHGHRAHGDLLAAKATQAAAEVTRWLEGAETGGWDVTDLDEESRALRAALSNLQSPAQLAA